MHRHLTEYILETFREKPAIYYLPFPTDLCDLCSERTQQGEPPSCVKHCQASCMTFGPIGELVKKMENKSQVVLYSPF